MKRAVMVDIRPALAFLAQRNDLFAGGSFLRKLHPHRAVALRVVAPALAHLHEQEQMHLLLGHLGDLLARLGADRLDGRAALAEHDLALALALHIDRLLDAHAPPRNSFQLSVSTVD